MNNFERVLKTVMPIAIMISAHQIRLMKLAILIAEEMKRKQGKPSRSNSLRKAKLNRARGKKGNGNEG